MVYHCQKYAFLDLIKSYCFSLQANNIYLPVALVINHININEF